MSVWVRIGDLTENLGAKTFRKRLPVFVNAIKSNVHPGTWAVVGIKRDALGNQIAHRGTAFAVDKRGHLLTCWHVTYMDNDCQLECDEFLVLQPELGPARFSADLMGKERDRDIALLKIRGDVKTSPLRLRSHTVPFGKSCCAFGHPLSVTDVATKSMRIFTRAAAGIVSMPYVAARFPGTRPVRLYELDFFTHGGSSGGPVFLANGDAIAVVSGCLLLDDGSGKQTRSNLTMAIHIEEAIEFLQPFDIDLEIRRGSR